MRARLADYLEHVRSLNLSPCTLRAVRYNVTNFLDWLEAAGRLAFHHQGDGPPPP